MGQITEFEKLFLAPAFLSYAGVLIVAALVIIFYFAPKSVLRMFNALRLSNLSLKIREEKHALVYNGL